MSDKDNSDAGCVSTFLFGIWLLGAVMIIGTIVLYYLLARCDDIAHGHEFSRNFWLVNYGNYPKTSHFVDLFVGEYWVCYSISVIAFRSILNIMWSGGLVEPGRRSATTDLCW